MILSDVERADLLSGPHVGIIAVAAGESPTLSSLATPVWYAVEPDGALVLVTGGSSRKARLLAAAGRATFLVHESNPPRHAAADVDVELAAPDDAVRRRITARYLPPEAVEPYLAATADADTVVVRLRPTRWRSMDLTKAGG